MKTKTIRISQPAILAEDRRGHLYATYGGVRHADRAREFLGDISLELIERDDLLAQYDEDDDRREAIAALPPGLLDRVTVWPERHSIVGEIVRPSIPDTPEQVVADYNEICNASVLYLPAGDVEVSEDEEDALVEAEIVEGADDANNEEEEEE